MKKLTVESSCRLIFQFWPIKMFKFRPGKKFPPGDQRRAFVRTIIAVARMKPVDRRPTKFLLPNKGTTRERKERKSRG